MEEAIAAKPCGGPEKRRRGRIKLRDDDKGIDMDAARPDAEGVRRIFPCSPMWWVDEKIYPHLGDGKYPVLPEMANLKAIQRYDESDARRGEFDYTARLWSRVIRI